MQAPQGRIEEDCGMNTLPSAGAGRDTGLKPNAKLVLGLLWCALFLAVPSRGQSGIEFVTVAIVLCILFLPIQYAAIAVALGPMLPTLMGGLPVWYTDKIRWALIFGGTAVLWFRCAKVSGRFRGKSSTPFVALLGVYAAAALLTIAVSTSTTLSLSKWFVLVTAYAAFSLGARWVVGTYGALAAKKWVQAWIVLLLPILIGDIAALFFGFGQTFQLGAYRGIAGNANGLGVMIAFVLPLLACQFVYARRRPSTKSQATAILMVALVYLLMLSWSRASVLACLVGTFVVWATHPRNQLTRFGVLAVVALTVVMLARPTRTVQRVENWIYKGKTQESLV